MGIYHVFVSGLHLFWFQRHLNSSILKRHFQPPTIMGVYSDISLSSCLYWYDTLNSCKYLKSGTHPQNAQVNKASSINKEIVKTCLIVELERKNCLWIFVPGCGLDYFVSARFGSFWFVANFSEVERFKYLFSQLWKFIPWLT